VAFPSLQTLAVVLVYLVLGLPWSASGVEEGHGPCLPFALLVFYRSHRSYRPCPHRCCYWCASERGEDHDPYLPFPHVLLLFLYYYYDLERLD